jgi:ATP-dependent Lon protease
MDNAFEIKINENPRDRDVCVDNGWVVKIGHGPDFLQKPDSWVGIGA